MEKEPINTTTAGDLAEGGGESTYDIAEESLRAFRPRQPAPPASVTMPSRIPQKRADTRPLPQPGPGVPAEVASLMQNEAYWSRSHPEHQAAVDAVGAAWERVSAAPDARRQVQAPSPTPRPKSLLDEPPAPLSYGPDKEPLEVTEIRAQLLAMSPSDPGREELLDRMHDAWAQVSATEDTVRGFKNEHAAYARETSFPEETIRATSEAARTAGIGPRLYGELMTWASNHMGLNEAHLTAEQAEEAIRETWGSEYEKRLGYANEVLREFPKLEIWLRRRSALNSVTLAHELSRIGEKRAALKKELAEIHRDPNWKTFDAPFWREHEALVQRAGAITALLRG